MNAHATYTFPARISFGPGDTAETEVDFDLTDDESLALAAAFRRSNETGESFCDIPEVASTYQAVYAAAVAQITKEMMASGELTEDADSADALYTIGVHFP